MSVYVFDMDGTLTPARLPMDEDFAKKFYKWQLKNKSFIATGSDYQKVQEQIPKNILDTFTGIYCSLGNILYVKDRVVYQHDFIPSEKLISLLEQFRRETKYPGRLYPNHIEIRIGMLNFSVLGRNCPKEDRVVYNNWDNESKERIAFQKVLQQECPELDITLGGKISMDISLKGKGKSQIAHHLRKIYPNDKIIFLGDRTMKGGNDYDIAHELMMMENTQVVQVDGHLDIEKFLNI